MTFPLMINDEWIDPFEYLSLDESIKPKETKFGSDLNDSHWLSFKDSLVYTFYKHSHNKFVCVSLNIYNGNIGFGVLNEFSKNPNEYSMDRTNTGDAISTLNKVFYVVLMGATKFKLNTLMLAGFDMKLDKVYATIVNNALFQSEIRNFGFFYDKIDNSKNYIFTRAFPL